MQFDAHREGRPTVEHLSGGGAAVGVQPLPMSVCISHPHSVGHFKQSKALTNFICRVDSLVSIVNVGKDLFFNT